MKYMVYTINWGGKSKKSWFENLEDADEYITILNKANLLNLAELYDRDGELVYRIDNDK